MDDVPPGAPAALQRGQHQLTLIVGSIPRCYAAVHAATLLYAPMSRFTFKPDTLTFS